jgi:hypothetical protein
MDYATLVILVVKHVEDLQALIVKVVSTESKKMIYLIKNYKHNNFYKIKK